MKGNLICCKALKLSAANRHQKSQVIVFFFFYGQTGRAHTCCKELQGVQKDGPSSPIPGCGWGVKGERSIYLFKSVIHPLQCPCFSHVIHHHPFSIHRYGLVRNGLFSVPPHSMIFFSPSPTMWSAGSQWILAASLLAQLFPLHALMLL